MELINRQDVINIIMGDGLYCDTYADKVYSAERIKNIPTVEPKKGKWRWVRMMTLTGGYDTYMCDQCEHLEKIKTNYCSNCGARMEESDG